MFDMVNSLAIAAAYFLLGWLFCTRILPAIDPHIGRSARSVMIWLLGLALMLFAAARFAGAFDAFASPMVYTLGHYALIGFAILFYRHMLRRTDGGGRWASGDDLP